VPLLLQLAPGRPQGTCCPPQKYGIFHQTLKTINSLPCQNVQVYFPNSERILPRFEAVTLKGAQYVQPYQHSPIIRIQYPGPL
jgi:hypothetical protein